MLSFRALMPSRQAFLPAFKYSLFVVVFGWARREANIASSEAICSRHSAIWASASPFAFVRFRIAAAAESTSGNSRLVFIFLDPFFILRQCSWVANANFASTAFGIYLIKDLFQYRIGSTNLVNDLLCPVEVFLFSCGIPIRWRTAGNITQVGNLVCQFYQF